MKKALLHIIEFSATGLIDWWRIWRSLRCYGIGPVWAMRYAWHSHVGYDREPFTGPRWERPRKS